MPSSNDNETRARLSVECSKRIAASASSMQQSDEHIAASRKAIARSLQMLTKTVVSPTR